MSERARTLAQQLEQANHDLIATIEGLSDAQWHAKTPGDGRSVGVVAHHVATSHKTVAGLAGAIAHGQAVPNITMDMIHHGNAAHAAQHAHCTKAETLALLRQNGAAAVASVRAFGDAELDRTAALPMGTVSVAQVVERVLTGHAVDHHSTIRRALA
ncbi:MAG: DinB family protein [Solirubrobacterales bacterium]|jgi:uncharacterized damage-inducible protein DinB